ncbi:cytochrome c, class I [Paraglaciecola sp. T6c]|uniref:c-type cytochrome n=1 Tax=Pseudoalteromonas atlantica (strain T6c / ATCC BAA-1087) TaxID=3042615 RepID=UPI00005C5B9F|nr:c-type cytochrome [Paraglaciecola sp. T6c]ABG40242.1 cytochrome c, class I [Paraglaciecola sp. T6c]
MSLKSTLFALLLAGNASALHASEAITPEGLEYCTVCHGSQLKGNANIQAPRLGGLSKWYIERQLNNFKQGIRGAHTNDVTGSEMQAMARHLTPSDISAIASWIGQTESPKPATTLHGDIDAGKTLYQACAACHGADGGGNKAIGAPRLSGINDWYVLTQINHFREGIRGNDQKDIYGQQMKAAVSMVQSDPDAVNLAAYISQLK